MLSYIVLLRRRGCSLVLKDYQSINQSIKVYSPNIPGEARLNGMTGKSVFNSKINEAVL